MRPEGQAFVAALLEGDRRRALEIAAAALRAGAHYLYEEVVGPSMYEIGELWQAGRITVADEHVATAIAQSVVSALYPQLPWSVDGPKAVVACVECERHEFCARMAADLLMLDGWDVIYVGSDVPDAALGELVERVRPRLVGLSATLEVHLPAMRSATALVRSVVPETRIVAGGKGTARAVEADLPGVDVVVRTATAAVEAVRPWKR